MNIEGTYSGIENDIISTVLDHVAKVARTLENENATTTKLMSEIGFFLAPTLALFNKAYLRKECRGQNDVVVITFQVSVNT